MAEHSLLGFGMSSQVEGRLVVVKTFVRQLGT